MSIPDRQQAMEMNGPGISPAAVTRFSLGTRTPSSTMSAVSSEKARNVVHLPPIIE